MIHLNVRPAATYLKSADPPLLQIPHLIIRGVMLKVTLIVRNNVIHRIITLFGPGNESLPIFPRHTRSQNRLHFGIRLQLLIGLERGLHDFVGRALLGHNKCILICGERLPQINKRALIASLTSPTDGLALLGGLHFIVMLFFHLRVSRTAAKHIGDVCSLSRV